MFALFFSSFLVDFGGDLLGVGEHFRDIPGHRRPPEVTDGEDVPMLQMLASVEAQGLHRPVVRR